MRIAIMGTGSLGTILGAYLTKAGYEVYFALLKETAIGDWSKFRSKFGY